MHHKIYTKAGTTHNFGKMIHGRGAFLLDGGAGGQNSYRSIEDYIETTGRNPMSGAGLGDIKKKLNGLVVIPTKKQRKNINFNI